MTGPEGWQAEQELQSQKLINYVTSTSGNRPAVILGDMNAGLGFPANDIVAEGEETFNVLDAAFIPAYTAEYLGTPLCTFCSTNPVTNPDNDPEETSVWIDHIFLYNLRPKRRWLDRSHLRRRRRPCGRRHAGAAFRSFRHALCDRGAVAHQVKIRSATAI